jgi:RNA-directed DNA polymerase
VLEDGTVRTAVAGTPQGGVISPLLANIYLDALDEAWEHNGAHLGRLVRYADDFVVLCRRRSQAEQALRRVQEILDALKLKLHPTKTRLVELGLGKDGFVFLGCYFRIIRSHFKGKRYLFRWPAPRAMNAIRTRIRELTDRRRWAGMRDIRDVIEVLNPVLRGWGNYFRTGNASDKFNAIDGFVRRRLLRLLLNRGQRRQPINPRAWTHRRFVDDFGLYKLLGTIRFPGGAYAT